MIFIGTGALGPLGSFQTCLLAVVNVLMQIVFATRPCFHGESASLELFSKRIGLKNEVAIAYYNFTLPDIDENSVRDTLRWRRSSGHSFSDYSDVAKESLVHRVCKLDKSLFLGSKRAFKTSFWPRESSGIQAGACKTET